MKKWRAVLVVVTLAVTLIVVLGWIFVVPGELKTLVQFSRWHDKHVRASGYVDGEPAGTRIYWEEFGNADGPPVVVLHAGLTSIAFMGGQIEALATEFYRVIAIDSRGHGKSSNTAPVPTYEMMTDDVVAVMDARKIAKADVVGWSDGGNVGLDLARRYPDRVRKLVAFGANHTPPPDGQDAEMTKEFKEAKPDAGMFFPLRYLYQKNSPTPDKWPEFFERERAMVFAGPNGHSPISATFARPCSC
jgi:pimeloyl-ACP methyl ester carboxylesterase